ncbi:MAG: hypothetical protein R3C56_28975 [Pirellulaceae bacterium]
MSNASSDSLQPPASLTWPLDLLRRWTGLMAAVLIAATWPLWWGVSDFLQFQWLHGSIKFPCGVIACAVLHF